MEKKIVVAVKGIIILNNKVLVVKRSEEDDVGGGTWEFAGGKIEFGEELEDALEREVQEEVGLDVDVDKLLYATSFKSSSNRQVVILSYRCWATTDKVKLSEEHTEYAWVSEKELRSILFPGILEDMDKHNAFSSLFSNP